MSVDMQVASPQSNAPVVDEKRPRRWRWAFVAAIAAAVLIIAGVVYVTHDQPIQVGGSVTSGQYIDPTRADLDGDLRAYTYHEGGLIFVGLWIGNTGRLPITITGVVQSPGGWEGLITRIAPRLGRDNDPTNLAVSQPFRSFSLSGSEQRLVDVVFRMGNCATFDPDTSMSMTSVTLHYTVLGMHRSEDLPLPTGVWVTAPSRADCRAGS